MSNTAQNLLKIIDFVKARMNTQRMPSYSRRSDVDGEVEGLYRMNGHGKDEHNISCPVGHLIPDECYDPSMEYNSADEIFDINWIPLLVKDVTITDDTDMYKELLLNLQTLHDSTLEDIYHSHRGMMHNKHFMEEFNQRIDRLRNEYLLA